jgi:hypothetical protein
MISEEWSRKNYDSGTGKNTIQEQEKIRFWNRKIYDVIILIITILIK